MNIKERVGVPHKGIPNRECEGGKLEKGVRVRGVSLAKLGSEMCDFVSVL